MSDTLSTNGHAGTPLYRQLDVELARRAADVAEQRLRAARAKAHTQAISMALGDFDAARRTRVRPGPRPRGGSADSHRDRQTLDALRRDCNSLLRNDKLARSMVKRLCDYVVGDAVRLQVKSDDEGFNDRCERFIAQWWSVGTEHCSGAGPDGRPIGRGGVELCRLAVRACMGSGGTLALLTDAGRVQLIEYERLRTPNNVRDGSIVNGVEYSDDGHGVVTAYHVSEWNAQSGGAHADMATRRIASRFVLNLANPADDDVNVTLPEPGLTALIEDFATIRAYIKDTQLASRMATFFGLVTETAYPQDFALQMPGSTVNVPVSDGSTTTQREIEIEPGFAAHLQPGETIKQIDPKHPTTVFGDFITTNLVLLGAECGLPLVLWTLDMTKVNFASARSAVLLAWATVRVWRHWLTTRFVVPLVRWRTAMAIRRGELDPGGSIPNGWDRVYVSFPPMPVIDPMSQYQAEAYAVDKRLRTHRDVWESLNTTDYDEGTAQIAAEQERLRELRIAPIYEPGQLDTNVQAEPSGDSEAVDE